MTQVRVIGAGLSGLAAAWYLTKAGARVEIIDASSRPGGLIATSHLPQGIVESAANALLWTSDVQELFADLGITPVFPRRQSRRRYILRDGRPRRWPLSPIETFTAAATFGARWTAGSTAPFDGESVAAWGRRVLGRAATEHLLEPALQGIYAAPASSLSAGAIGLGRRRPRPGLAAPAGGMGELIAALHAALERSGARFHFDTRLDSLEPGARAIVCTDAPSAARLVSSAGIEPLAGALRRVQTLPLVTATAFFEPLPADLRGFGVLFPRGTARALGVLFNSDTFEGRGPMRSETWIYGDRALIDAGDAAITAAILEDRRHTASASTRPAAVSITRVPSALPIYDVAIGGVARALEALPPWLGVCGNYTGKIGVAALIARAKSEAGRVGG